MRNIHYIAYYGKPDNDRNLNIVPAGMTKVSYIISALKRAGYQVTLFSTAGTKNRFGCHYKRYEEWVDNDERTIFINTFGSKYKVIRGLALLWMWLQLFIYLVFDVKTGEAVIVYHSCSYKYPILFARLFKRFNLVFEVEELYNASLGKGKNIQEKEIKYLKNADAYILVNDLMAERCGFRDKPFIVSYGSYAIPIMKSSHFEDVYIHIIYAGIIEKKKLGAFIAVESARYLTDKYKLHILGFGCQEDIEDLKKLISEVNEYIGRESVIYHGIVYGNEYSEFLKKCQIGLSTHTMEGDFVGLTFPSKLLVYIAHNVIPVCSPISCVEISKIADSIVFYCENTPQAVAQAVMSINISEERNLSDLLVNLDKDFLKELRNLLK